MRLATFPRLVFAGLVLLSASAAPAAAVEGWRWVPVTGVRAELSKTPDGVAARFTKTGGERRLLALETRPAGKAAEAKAIEIRCRLTLTEGQAALPAVLLFDADGGVWYSVGRPLVPGEEAVEVRLPVTRLKEAGFSQDADGKLTTDALAKTWIGLVFDEPAAGAVEFSGVHFTSEPYRPTRPLPLDASVRAAWSVSKDRAVNATLTTPKEGPKGVPCMKYEWTQPGHRHMFSIPQLAVGGEELIGYRALRFTYTAKLPAGIEHLFVALQERGGAQYYTDSTAPEAGEWKTITLPLSKLKLGTWSEDANGRLDLGEVASVAIGCHGTSTEPKSQGLIRVAEVEFLP
jgi:hypothetical protein